MMPTPFDVLSQPWIPVRLESGNKAFRTVASILADRSADPPVVPAWGRADLDGATLERLIACLALAYPVDHRRWVGLHRSPPSEVEIAERLVPYRAAFNLDGHGPRFMQDLAQIEGEQRPASSLFIDAPGENALLKNTDLLVKRDGRRGGTGVLSRAAATIALDALQTWAPAGGQGHRTSIRGGGPMTTLVVPPAPHDRPLALADVILWNLPNREVGAGPVEPSRVFPWLLATRTSGKDGQATTPADVDPLQALHGMPRRIRLVFTPNVDRYPCDITGMIDDVVVTGFVTTNYGTNYAGPWRHPLTPYQKSRSGDLLPIHPQPGGVTWDDWIGIVAGDEREGREPAAVIREAHTRGLDTHLAGEAFGVRVHGFDMDNMKARGFVEQELPLFVDVDPDAALAREEAARALILAADVCKRVLTRSIKVALFGETNAADAKGDFSVWSGRLIADTEAEFYKAITAKAPKAAEFREVLARATLTLFDEAADLDAIDDFDRAKDIAVARKSLVLMFAGYGKAGTELFSALGIAPPKPAKPAAKKGRTP